MQNKYTTFLEKNPEYAGFERLCNICGFRFAKFLPFGNTKREARCPLCASLERHRHLHILLLSIFPGLKGKKILHFAPEPIFLNLLKNSDADYYDADIREGVASYVADITNINFEDNTFDYCIAIHVLEHIIDDIKAFKELHRVLKVGGVAFLSVPTLKEPLEDPSITSPEDRLKFFGKDDHVRFYSEQLFQDRIKDAGFEISVSTPYSFPESISSACKLGDHIVLAKKIR